MPDPRILSAERIRLAADACKEIDERIKLANDLLHSNGKNQYGVLIDSGRAHARLSEAMRLIVAATKIIELTQWPRPEDYRNQ